MGSWLGIALLEPVPSTNSFFAGFDDVPDPRAANARHDLCELPLPANIAIPRRRALDLARRDTSEGSLSIKLKRAGYSDAFLRSLLKQLAKVWGERDCFGLRGAVRRNGLPAKSAWRHSRRVKGGDGQRQGHAPEICRTRPQKRCETCRRGSMYGRNCKTSYSLYSDIAYNC